MKGNGKKGMYVREENKEAIRGGVERTSEQQHQMSSWQPFVRILPKRITKDDIYANKINQVRRG